MVGTSNQSLPVAWPLTHHRFSCLIRPEVNLLLRAEPALGPWVNLPFGDVFCHTHMAVGQNLVPLVNIKIAGKWMFIPLKMVLIGIDSHPYIVILGMISVRCSAWLVARFFCPYPAHPVSHHSNWTHIVEVFCSVFCRNVKAYIMLVESDFLPDRICFFSAPESTSLLLNANFPWFCLRNLHENIHYWLVILHYFCRYIYIHVSIWII